MRVKLIFLILAIIIFSSCGKKAATDSEGNALESRSILQIHNDEGVPVKVSEIKKENFSVVLKYSATVTGINESSASATVSDTVEKVLFKVGDFVEKNTVIIRFPQNNLSANYFQAKAAYENSLETFRRIEQLYKSKGVSRQDFDNVRTAFNVARANWDNVNKMVNVTAPIKGYITRLDVRESENVKPGDHLFTIANYDKLTTKVWIQEKEIQKIKSGMNASAEWEGNKINGKVTQIDLSLNPSRQAFGAFVEFDNSSRKIMSGVNAEINIFIYENNAAIVVDKKYITESESEKYVYTVSDNVPVKKEIKTGWQNGEKTEIVQGLKQGDIIVTEGTKLITDSSKLKIITGE